MLIANLKANSATPEPQDWAWPRCNTPHGVWVRYPKLNKGMNPPIVAETPPAGSAITFINFEDPDGFCGSNNERLVQALAMAE